MRLRVIFLTTIILISASIFAEEAELTAEQQEYQKWMEDTWNSLDPTFRTGF